MFSISGSHENGKLELRERLAAGTIICAEGYLFELERRGYMQAGPYVPEVVLAAPEVVKRLHEVFVCTAGMAAAATVPA
jgi:betaine-homocysteine S-methyltransferase